MNYTATATSFAVDVMGAAIPFASVSAVSRAYWLDCGDNAAAARSFTASPRGRVEIAFSAHDGAEALLLLVIRISARSAGQLRMLARSFTSGSITHVFLLARQAGGDLALVGEARECGKRDGPGKASRNVVKLPAAGVDVRTFDTYLDAHEKPEVAGATTVATGSYNDSEASPRANSENAFVLWDTADAAQVSFTHFYRKEAQAVPPPSRR